MAAMARSAIAGLPPNPRGSGPTHTPMQQGLPPCSRELPRFAAAGAESGSPAFGAFAAAIELDSEGKAPEWIQLFPKGPKLETVNYDSRSWTLSDPAAVAAASMADGLDLPIDWEHAQAIKAPKGKRAKTAGWIKQIAVRSGVLFGRVEWTAAGRASLESRQYKYFSPGFLAEHGNDGGEVRRIQHGGLVKTPAFAMPALTGRQQGGAMLKKILEALGLSADATEEQAVAAACKLKDDLAAARASAETPSLEKFVPRADYDAALARATTAEGKLASQSAAARDEEIKQALDSAQEAGKITPATRSYHEARCQAEGGLEAFKAFVAAAPEIAGRSGVTGAPPEKRAGAFASAEEGQIAKAFGRDAKFLDEHAPQGGKS